MSATQEDTGLYIQDVQEQHREIIRHRILGWKPGRIAEHLGCTYQHVYRVLDTPIVKNEVARLSGRRDDVFVEIKTRIDELLPEAVDTFERVLSQRPMTVAEQRLQVDVAKDVLDRRGPEKRSTVAVANTLSLEDLDEIRSRSDAIKIQHEEISDAADSSDS